MPIELFYVMIALSLFLTVLALQTKGTAFCLLSIVFWFITTTFPFYLEFLYTFYDPATQQTVEHIQAYTDAWPLGVVFFGFGFTMLVYWLRLVFGGGGVTA